MYALLVTDDADDAVIFTQILQRAGLAVTTANNLNTALQNWTERPADLILSAISKPTAEHQIRDIRAVTLVPIIILVKELNAYLHYDLLKLGADLVIEPLFNARLLIAQVGVLMRRAGSIPSFTLPTMEAPGLSLDPSNRTILVEGKPPQRLTHLEFRLLYTLMTNRNIAISADTIVESVWGYSGQGDRDLVRGLINRLRAKIEVDRRKPRYVLTMPGVGYKFSDHVD